MALVNPFSLNTGNMSRIEPFNLMMPRRLTFRLQPYYGGIKSKLIFNDYSLFFEKQEGILKRLFEASGIVPKNNYLVVEEAINEKDCEGKLIKINKPQFDKANKNSAA